MAAGPLFSLTKDMTDGRFVIRIGERESPITSRADLERHIAEIEARPFADLWLVKRGTPVAGFERWIYKLLGLSVETDEMSLYVLAAPDGAVAVFLDGDFHEYRCAAATGTAVEGAVEFELSNGQRVRHPAAEVLSRDVAFDALRSFFDRGERPPSFVKREKRGRAKGAERMSPMRSRRPRSNRSRRE